MNEQQTEINNSHIDQFNSAGRDVVNLIQADPPRLILELVSENASTARRLVLRNVGGRTAHNISYQFGGNGYDSSVRNGLTLEPGGIYPVTAPFITPARQRSDLRGACITASYSDATNNQYFLIEPEGWQPDQLEENEIVTIFRFEPQQTINLPANRLAQALWQSAIYFSQDVAFFPPSAVRGSHRAVDTGIQVNFGIDRYSMYGNIRLESCGRIVLRVVQATTPPMKYLETGQIIERCILFILLIHRIYRALGIQISGQLEMELQNLNGSMLPDNFAPDERRLPMEFNAVSDYSHAHILLSLPVSEVWSDLCAQVCKNILEDCFSVFPGNCRLAGIVPAGTYPDTCIWTISIEAIKERIASVTSFAQVQDVQ